MKYEEARAKFISTWEQNAPAWGISPSAARLHALLMTSPDPLTTDDVMQELSISRGNASMNLRELEAWGIIHRETLAGSRLEYFRAEKDIWKVARLIVRERRRRELTPLIAALREIKASEGSRSEKKFRALAEPVSQLEKLLTRVDYALDKAVRLDERLVKSVLFKLFR